MINQEDNPVAWTLLVQELIEAHEHLGDLVESLSQDRRIVERKHSVDFAHIYAHLNRAWNSRNTREELTEEQWANFRKYPTDLEPLV